MSAWWKKIKHETKPNASSLTAKGTVRVWADSVGERRRGLRQLSIELVSLRANTRQSIIPTPQSSDIPPMATRFGGLTTFKNHPPPSRTAPCRRTPRTRTCQSQRTRTPFRRGGGGCNRTSLRSAVGAHSPPFEQRAESARMTSLGGTARGPRTPSAVRSRVRKVRAVASGSRHRVTRRAPPPRPTGVVFEDLDEEVGVGEGRVDLVVDDGRVAPSRAPPISTAPGHGGLRARAPRRRPLLMVGGSLGAFDGGKLGLPVGFVLMVGAALGRPSAGGRLARNGGPRRNGGRVAGLRRRLPPRRWAGRWAPRWAASKGRARQEGLSEGERDGPSEGEAVGDLVGPFDGDTVGGGRHPPAIVLRTASETRCHLDRPACSTPTPRCKNLRRCPRRWSPEWGPGRTR